MTAPVEFANASRGVGNAYQSVANFLGVDVAIAARAAQTGQLAALIEQRNLTRPVSGAEALRRIESLRRPPWQEPRSPAELISELTRGGTSGRPRNGIGKTPIAYWLSLADFVLVGRRDVQ